MRIISGYGGLKVRGTFDPGACHCPRWFGLFLRKPRNPPSQNLMRPRCSQGTNSKATSMATKSWAQPRSHEQMLSDDS